MKNIVTAIAMTIALPAAAHAAPAAKPDTGKAKTNCMSNMHGHDMSKMDMKGMDMKGHDMAGMNMQGHDMTKMQSCADAAQKGASTPQNAHSNHAR